MSRRGNTASATDAEFDYIVIGAGSSGCVVANRLSERHSVVVIEAGPDDRLLSSWARFSMNLHTLVPVGFSRNMINPGMNWGYASDPEAGAGGRVFDVPRGKVLGGCSAINGLAYIRGLPADYDEWRDLGCPGWGWDDVHPYFRRAERTSSKGGTDLGTDGPQHVSPLLINEPTTDSILEAFGQAGIPTLDSLSQAKDEAVGRCESIVHRGLRVSTARAYLHPVKRRRTLEVMVDTAVSRIIFEGNRAVGVEIVKDGERRQIRARAEVIVSAGAINSPILLQKSGIGPASLLGDLGVPVLVDSAEVGENLQDHYLISTTARLKPGTPSLNELTYGMGFISQLLQFVTRRTGMLTIPPTTVTGLARSTPDKPIPDLQVFGSPITPDFELSAKIDRYVVTKFPGISMNAYIVKPRSRGFVRARTNGQAPQILHNFLTHPEDQHTAINIVHLLRKVQSQPALAAIIESELTPGGGLQSNEDLLNFARQTGGTVYHPVGTCRMGSDAGSVLDPQLRVRGVDGLRVVDGSIMPQLVSANTNAACIMIGERASDLILADAR